MLRTISVAAVISLLLGGAAQAQPVPYEKVDDADLVHLMNRIEVLGEVANDALAVRVLSVANLPGSADSENGEITHTVYIGVSEYDELPEQSLFKFSDVFAPRLERTEKETLTLYLSFGAADARNIIRIEPTLTELNLEETNHP